MDDEALDAAVIAAVRRAGRKGIVPVHVTVLGPRAEPEAPAAVAASVTRLLASGALRWRDPRKQWRVMAGPAAAPRRDNRAMSQEAGLW